MDIPYSNWIWTPEWSGKCDESPAFVNFRKTFNWNGGTSGAAGEVGAGSHTPVNINISADSRYKLYVNGVFVHCGPRKGDAKVWYYDTLDIAPYLKDGKNVLAVEVLRYPLAHRKGNHGIWRTETPGLYVSSKMAASGGSADANCANGAGSSSTDGANCPNSTGCGSAGDPVGAQLSADQTWKVKINPSVQIVSESPYFAPLQILENAAGNPELAGWMEPDYDDSSWSDATPYISFFMPKAVSPGNLLPRPIPLMKNTHRQFKEVYCVRESGAGKPAWDQMLKSGTALHIGPGSHEIVEIDAGELTTGYLKLAFAAGAGAQVKILTSECYAYPPKTEHRMAMPQKGDRTDCVNGKLYGFTDTYKPAGFGSAGQPEIYEPYWFRTFRYIQLDITTADEPLELFNFDYIETGYPLEVKTKIETSDPVMNEIWALSLRTLKRCMHETYEDCPFYEQLQYAMDTRSQILYTYSVSGDDRLARQCIDDFHRSVRYDGLINCSYPSYGPNVIPGFSIYYILMIYDHMMYFADKELIRRYMPTVEGILDFYRRNINEQGLVGKIGGLNGRDRYWSFIDWTPQWDATTGVPTATLTGPITMESFLYAYGLQHAAKMMTFIGRSEDSSIYMAQADAVLAAIEARCLGENGLYQDGPGVADYSQHCQVFAVLTGAKTGEEARRLMLEVLPEDKPYARCSVAMAFYLFRAVEKAGLYDMTDALWEPWRRMVKNHLTTSVEDEVNSRSDCHAWGALALYELPAVMLGIRPEKPGFEDFTPSAVNGPFEWVKGDVVTPFGEMHIE